MKSFVDIQSSRRNMITGAIAALAVGATARKSSALAVSSRPTASPVAGDLGKRGLSVNFGDFTTAPISETNPSSDIEKSIATHPMGGFRSQILPPMRQS